MQNSYLGLAVSFLLWLPAANGAGVIRGSVVDSVSGGALAGVHIVAARNAAEMKVATAMPYRGISDEKGAFTLAGVEDGNYQVCAIAVGGYLSLCLWGQPVPVRVASSTVEARLALQRGVPLTVAFADEKAALDRFRGRPAVPPVFIEITGPDQKKRLIPTAGNTHGSFTELVPEEVPLTVTVRTNLLSLADSTGRAINAASGYQTQVRVPRPAVSPVPLMFNAGRRSVDFRVVFRVLGLTPEGEIAVAK
ncbi:MAG: carboxypeptidase regulatory-like domain-containing protein [Acidobacteria bacterium]|nr:carboxypeptidase regulatory-like domain-containing protein [Acidobacteriota bacterium]